MNEGIPELEPAEEGLGGSGAARYDVIVVNAKSGAMRRAIGVLALVVVAIGGLTTLAFGLGVWATMRAHAETTVPDITGQSVATALEQIRSAQLASPIVATVATSQYAGGVVVSQQPTGHSRVAPDVPIGLVVAVPPAMTVTPDVSFETVPVAEGALGAALLKPAVYQQLSDVVPYGRVVSQMPRAGQPIMTGQKVVLFVSMGRGTGGAPVPSVLGQTVDEATKTIAGVYLLAAPYRSRSGVNPADRVTDQVPEPGTLVPIGSAVPLMVASAPGK